MTTWQRTAIAIALAAIAFGSDARAQSLQPSKRIMRVCSGFSAQMVDLATMSGGITDRDEHVGVIGMAGVAELNNERCVSVHSLLFLYEQLSEGPDRARAGAYIAFRMEQYAGLKSDLEFANKAIGQTKLPGVAREAQRLRDQLRAFADTVRALKPR